MDINFITALYKVNEPPKPKGSGGRKQKRYPVGDEMLTINEAADRAGINRRTLRTRMYHKKQSLEDALNPENVISFSEAGKRGRKAGRELDLC